MSSNSNALPENRDDHDASGDTEWDSVIRIRTVANYGNVGGAADFVPTMLPNDTYGAHAVHPPQPGPLAGLIDAGENRLVFLPYTSDIFSPTLNAFLNSHMQDISERESWRKNDTATVDAKSGPSNLGIFNAGADSVESTPTRSVSSKPGALTKVHASIVYIGFEY
jgi:hypothetical protein